jgi:Meiotically up-regulated gene 113
LSVAKEYLLQEIARLAALDGGIPPGQIKFASATGIGSHKWRGVYWARWGDALTEAGFLPKEWSFKLDSNSLLTTIASIVLEQRKLPTKSELEMLRQQGTNLPTYSTIIRHFGSQDGLIAALRALSSANPSFSDLDNLLPKKPVVESTVSNKVPDGWVYLLKSGENYKIGRSENLERRIKQINIALPETTILFHAVQTDDPPGIEAYWHKRFADRRLNGEWFKLSKQDVASFKRRKFM